MEINSNSLLPPMKRRRVQDRDVPDSQVTKILQPGEIPNMCNEVRTSPIQVVKSNAGLFCDRTPSTAGFYIVNLSPLWVQLKRQLYYRDRDSKNGISEHMDIIPGECRRNPFEEVPQQCSVWQNRSIGQDYSPKRGTLQHCQLSQKWKNGQDLHDEKSFMQPRQFRGHQTLANQGHNHLTGHDGSPSKVSSTFKPVELYFDGTNCSWESFLQQLRHFSRHYTWSESEFNTQLLLFMKGEALSYVTSLHYQTVENPDALFQALEEKFGQKRLMETPSTKCSTFSKSGQESWPDFSGEVYIDDVLLIFN